MSDRINRVNSVIMRSLSMILLQSNSILKHLSITEVQTAKDLSVAKIFYRILPHTNTSDEQLCQTLEKQKKTIRYQLAKDIQLRKTPKLTFIFDTLIDDINHIENVFKKIAA